LQSRDAVQVIINLPDGVPIVLDPQRGGQRHALSQAA
jgi:hypothetical protein